MSVLEFIKECQEKVFAGTHISAEDAKKLLNIPDENLKDLAKCANEITRDFNGEKVDVEQLNNIKKNGVYLRTLGNIVMLVPPLAISENELNSLLNRTIKTIKSAKSNLV